MARQWCQIKALKMPLWCHPETAATRSTSLSEGSRRARAGPVVLNQPSQKPIQLLAVGVRKRLQHCVLSAGDPLIELGQELRAGARDADRVAATIALVRVPAHETVLLEQLSTATPWRMVPRRASGRPTRRIGTPSETRRASHQPD